MNERPSYLTWMVCFLAGSVAGAGAALLMAPQAGKVGRNRMSHKLRHPAGILRALRDRMAGQATSASAIRSGRTAPPQEAAAVPPA